TIRNVPARPSSSTIRNVPARPSSSTISNESATRAPPRSAMCPPPTHPTHVQCVLHPPVPPMSSVSFIRPAPPISNVSANGTLR
ncbi:hypothetical protein T492DRAFT_1102136, partial [Pavlovales sp. CCMP2436]